MECGILAVLHHAHETLARRVGAAVVFVYSSREATTRLGTKRRAAATSSRWRD